MDQRVFDTLEARVPFTLANRAMKRSGLDGSQGWEGAIQKYGNSNHPNAEAALKEVLRQHALCGEKLTKFYSTDSETLEALRTQIQSLKVQDNVFQERYPFVLSESELLEAPDSPTLVAIEEEDDGIGAVYSSMIKLTSREELKIDEIFEHPDQIRMSYDEVIGLKFRAIQIFNIVWVPHDGKLIEIRTDLPRGMKSELSHEIQSTYRELVNGLLIEPAFGSPVDLFPLIASMYEDDEEGDVVELSFKTSTASIKNERMRRARLCLREELYHKGGKVALGTKIEPFKVSIRWSFSIDGQDYQPELTLAGSSRGLHTATGHSTGPLVTGASIKNCLGSVDYEYVKERLEHHMSKLGLI